MNAWIWAAAGLLVALVPCGISVFRGQPTDRLVGLEMAGIVESILLIVLAEAFRRPDFTDLAVAAALLTFGGGLVFARFLERWL
jgi:multicomponent Na+:H+ antiporter subunit F